MPYLAGAIALINSVGNLGGYVGPHAVGKLKDATGNDFLALLLLGGSLLGMAVFTFAIPRYPAQTQIGSNSPEPAFPALFLSTSPALPLSRTRRSGRILV